jgi:hypothetical protein
MVNVAPLTSSTVSVPALAPLARARTCATRKRRRKQKRGTNDTHEPKNCTHTHAHTHTHTQHAHMQKEKHKKRENRAWPAWLHGTSGRDCDSRTWRWSGTYVGTNCEQTLLLHIPDNGSHHTCKQQHTHTQCTCGLPAESELPSKRGYTAHTAHTVDNRSRTVRDTHADADIHILVAANGVCEPRAVHLGHLPPHMERSHS